MTPEQAEQLARRLLRGELSTSDFAAEVASPSVADLGEAQLDLDRQARCGFPEVVYGSGKTVAALEKIFRRLLETGTDVLATRIDAQQAAALLPRFDQARYNEVGRIFRVTPPVLNEACQPPPHAGRVAIVTAGTSDLPVAEEARETALWMGAAVELFCDIGVAGPQRLRAKVPELRKADAIVVIAGMEGALPSVVGGHVACPVIAVPTSVGYGANFGGVSALLSMLNSCAANVAVVNIDAGFKGAYLAGLIARRAAGEHSTANG
jgi:NCAIR mutase (PurE)-related protein